MNEIIATRQPTWAKIGTDVTQCKTIDQVLATAGLDYKVIQKPAKVRMGGRDRIVPGEFFTMRKDESRLYGNVKKRYKIVQNMEAFDPVSYMGDGIRFLKAGETESGMVYIIAALPDYNILGDAFTPNIIFSNGFSGSFSVRAALCSLRIICENQFTMVFKNAGSNSYVYSHTKNVSSKIKAGAAVMKRSVDYMQSLNSLAERYACTPVSMRQIILLVEAEYPIKAGATDEEATRVINNRKKFTTKLLEAYDADDNQNFKGTAWGIVNAYTDLNTHANGKAESLFQRVTFGNDQSRFIEKMESIIF